MSKIEQVHAREVLDSRGNPTVEAEVILSDGSSGRAIVPSGASTGQYEAVELRDYNENRYLGRGVLEAVNHVKKELNEAVHGLCAYQQCKIDACLREADGSENKGKLGANSILAVSMATARAAANSLNIPLYRYLGGTYSVQMPVPMMNILNGGVHADNTVDLQEFMIMPVGASCFRESIRMCTEIYHTLKAILKDKNLSTGVGDEGGFAPNLFSAKEVFNLLSEAVEKSGYHLGTEIGFAMDAASSELYLPSKEMYYFPGESKMIGKEIYRTVDEMIDYFEILCKEFPILSIEDALDEMDWNGWKKLTSKLGGKVQLVGDDLFVTNAKRLRQGIAKQAGNAILIKVNQIGTLTETFETIDMAHKAGYRSVISHRSGETEDTFIADLAVAVNSGQIKTGAPCRSDRTSKYNRLIYIEEQLGNVSVYRNPFMG
ncbi:MAG: phosphopyruvate hydratase [Lachnospiraceae bacterium]